jgi:hypothetical protein
LGRLNVVGSYSTTQGQALVQFNQTGTADIFAASASGTTKFVINNNGNVGVGTNIAASRLDLVSSATNTDVQRWMASDGSRLGRLTETSGGAGWFEVDNASGVAQALLRGDGGASYIATGNFGIGSTTPGYRLDVVSGNAIAASFDGRVIGSNAVNSNEFVTLSQLTGGVGQYWQLNGNTLSPSNSTYDVLVGGTASTSAKFHIFALDNGSITAGTASTSGDLTFGAAATQNINVLGGQRLDFRTSPGGDAGLATRLSLTNNGNVGIGTTNPSSLFAVGSSSQLQINSSGNISQIGGLAGASLSNVSSKPALSYNASNINIANSSTISLVVNGSDKVYITSGGVALADLNLTGTNNNSVLKFSNTGSANQITIGNAAASGIPTIAATGSDTNIDLKLDGKGSGNIYLDSSATGNVGIGTTTTAYKLDVSGDFRTTNSITRSLQRTLPTTVNDEVDIGDFNFTNGGGSLEVSVVVPSSGYSQAKQYKIPVKYDQTGGTWTIAPAISSTGSYSSNDFELDVMVNASVASLRLRRTQGSTAGTAYITIKQEGIGTNTFTASTSTSSVAAPTNYFGSTVLTQVNGNVGIGTLSPSYKLDVNGNLNTTSLYLSGSQVTSTATELNYLDGTTVTAGGVIYGDGTKLANTGAGTAGYVLQSNGASAPTWVAASSIGTNYWQRNGQALSPLNITDDLLIGGAATSSAKIRLGGTTNADSFFNTGGNLGIGTTLPTSKLDVYSSSNATLSDATSYNFNVRQGAADLAIGGDANYSYIQSFNSKPLQINNQGNNTLINPGSGNVGIGSTTPAEKLDVAGNINTGTSGNKIILYRNGSTDATQDFLRGDSSNSGDVFLSSRERINFYLDSDNTGSGQYFRILSNGTPGGGTEVFRVADTGNVGIATTTVTSRLNLPSGTTAAEGIAFGSDVSLYRGTTNRLDLATGDSLNLVSGDYQVGATTVINSSRIHLAANGSAGTPAFTFSSDPNTGIFGNGSDILGFSTSGSERARFDANGNLGIGSTTPGAKVDLVSTGTTTNGINVTADSLTTGFAANLSSTSTGLTTGGLLNLDWSPGSATTATGDLLSLNVGVNGTLGNIFNVKDNGSSVFAVSQSQITANLPASFTAPGDTSFAYDINFTNPTASYIKSAAPLYIQAGETFNSSDLTLSTYNQGNVIIDSDALQVNNAATVSGALTVGGETTLSNYTTNGGVLYTNGSGVVAQTSAGTGTQCLLGGTTPTWGACSTGGGITGSGTTNFIPKFTSSSAIGNSLLYDDGTNVGIGSTVPTAKLDVAGNTKIQGYATVSASLAVGYSAVQAGIGNAVFSGNVGIGTTNPAFRLQVVGNGQINNITIADSGSGNSSINGNGYISLSPAATAGLNIGNASGTVSTVFGVNVTPTANGVNVGGSSNNVITTLSVDGQNSRGRAAFIVDQTASSNNDILSASASGTTRFVIKNNGNVGIGSTAPTQALDVAGNIALAAGGGIDTNASGTLGIGTGNATTLTLGRSGQTTVFGSTAWTATPTISGLITATSGLTANGALTANNTFTLGDGGDTGSVNTSDWDISTTGVMTGISGITTDGGYTQSGASANTFTGTSTFSGDIDSNGNLSVADTNIAFDGASTTFTTTGAFTLTPGGAVLLGDGGDTLQINSSDWDISTTGVMTGISGITTDGGYTQSGSSTNYFSGNVGIGTSYNVAKLTMAGGDNSTTFTNATIALGYSTTGQYPNFIHTRHNSASSTNNAIDFYTSDGTAAGVFPTNAVLGLSINGGNVGIGTTNVTSFNLQVAGHAGPNATNTYDLGSSSLQWRNVYAQNFYQNGVLANLTNYWQRNANAVSPANITDDLLIGGTATASAKIRLGGTANADSFFNTGGNIGFGTTNPTEKFHVQDSTAFLKFSNNGGLQIETTGNQAWTNFGTTSSSIPILSWYDSSNAELGRITGSGNVGIGSTTPGFKLDVNGTAQVTGALTLGTQATTTSHAVRADRTITAGAGLTGGGDLTADRTLSLDYSSLIRKYERTLSINGSTDAVGDYYDLWTIVQSEPSSIFDIDLNVTGTGIGATRRYRVDTSYNSDIEGAGNTWRKLTAVTSSDRTGSSPTHDWEVLMNVNGSTITLRAVLADTPTGASASTSYNVKIVMSEPLNYTFSGTVTPLATSGTAMTIPTTYVPLRFAGKGGNVGIGSTAPSQKLDVAGNIALAANGSIDTNASGTLTIGGTTATTLTLGRSGQTTVFGSTAWTATPTISGLITATSGLTSTGTLTANGSLLANNTFTLGDGGDTGSINTSDWDISTTGVMTGISGITNDGVYTQTGSSQNTFTGNLDATSGLDVTGANLTVGGANFAVTVGSGNITTAGDLALNGGDLTATGDVTINPAGGQLFLADTTTIAIGGHAGGAYNAISNSGGTPTNPNVTSDNDLYVQGDLDIGGTLYVGGNQIANYWQRLAGNLSPSTLNDTLSATSSAGVVATFTGTRTGAGPIFLVEDQASDTTPFTITDTGNVGIGTTAAGAMLDVNGNILLQGGGTIDARSSGTLTIGGTTATTLTLGRSGQTTVFGSTSWTATPTISGLITATSGLTANGALTANNTFTLGDGGDTGSVNTSDWDISTTGVLTGISGITTDGGYTQSGASANTFTGTTTFSGAIDSNGDLSIADTNIAFDGASTTFTTTGAFTLNTGGAVTLGDGGDTIAINSSDWDISTTGALTGISGITTDGGYTQTGSSVNSFSGNVGIGTTNPASFILQAAGNVGPNATNTYDLGSSSLQWRNIYAQNFYQNGTLADLTNYWQINTKAISPANSTYDVLVGGNATASAKIRLGGTANADSFFNTGGNVGIGITNPSTVFQVHTVSDMAYSTYIDGPNPSLAIRNNNDAVTTGLFRFISTGNSIQLQQNTAAGGDFSTTNIGLAMGNGGNVGIGSTNPGAKLDVAGNSIFSGNVGIGTTSLGSKVVINASLDGTTAGVGNQHLMLYNPNNTNGIGPFIGFATSTDPTQLGAKIGFIRENSNSQGHLAFFTKPNTTTGDTTTEKMRITSGGNVGIGTTNPGSRLDIAGGYLALDNGDFAATRGLRFRNTTDSTTPTGGGLYQANNNIVYLQAGSADSIRIRSSAGSDKVYFDTSGGNVGIGTATPRQMLSVNGQAEATKFVDYDNTSGTYYIDPAATGTSMVVAGNVGIGTTSPTHALDVNGQIRVRNGALQKYSTALGTNDLGLYSEAGEWIRFVTNAGDFRWFQDGAGGTTPVMVLNTSGNLGVGTSAPLARITAGTTTSNAVHIGQTDPATGAWLRNDGSNTVLATKVGSLFLGYNGTSSNLNFMAGGTTTQMTLNTSGNLGIGTTTVNYNLQVGAGASTTFGASGTYNPSVATMIGSTTNAALIGLILNSNEGVNNRRAMLFLDDNLGEYGFQSKATTGVPDFVVKGGSTEAFRVTAAGNIGIGSTAPNQILDVVGNALVSGNIGINTTSAYRELTVYGNNSNTNTSFMDIRNDGTGDAWMNFSLGAAGESYAVGIDNGTNGFQIGYNTSGPTGMATNTRFAIASNGNVGIGSTAPAKKLDVAGDLEIGGSTSTERWTINTVTDRSGASNSCDSVTSGSITQICFNSTEDAATEFTIDESGNSEQVGSSFTSGNPDIAEQITKFDSTIERGDILTVDDPGTLNTGNSYRDVLTKKSTSAYQRTIIGIVSSDPGLLTGIYERADNRSDYVLTASSAAITLSGRVPTKVSTINGTIQPGDFITASDIPGVGMKATKPGMVVGRALQAFTGQNDPQAEPINCPAGTSTDVKCAKIMVMTDLTWYDPTVEFSESGTFAISGHEESDFKAWAGQYQFQNKGGFAEAIIAKLTAGIVKTQQLVVNGTSTFVGTITAGSINASSLAVNSLSVAGQSLHDYILAVVQSAGIGNGSTLNSPVAQVSTGVISPLADDASQTVKIKGNVHIEKTASASGDLTVDGQISAQDASIAGTLRAGHIIADSIDGLDARIASLSANNITATSAAITNITNVYNIASSSGIASGSGSLAGGQLPPNFVSDSLYTGVANIASLSADLAYVPSFSADRVSISEGLMVFGTTSLSDTSVTGQLSVDGSLILSENSINVLGSTFNIQPLRQGNVAFEGGLVAIDTDGNLTVGGNAVFASDVTIGGRLAASIVSPVPNSDLIIQLPGDDSDTTRLAVDRPGITVKNGSGSAVLKITDVGDIIASGAALASQFQVARGVSADTSVTQTVATASAGTAMIKAGQYERTILSPYVTEKSLVYITPLTDTNGITPFIARQTAEDKVHSVKGSFTVRIPVLQTKDVKVNWWIIN